MEIRTKKEGNNVEISLIGRLDTQASPDFENVIASLADERDLNIVLDIADMEYISSSGVRCFVLLLRSAKAGGSTLEVKNMRPEIREIFDMTGLSKVFGLN